MKQKKQSKCCGSTYHTEGKTTQYYVCDKCGEATDAIEKQLGCLCLITLIVLVWIVICPLITIFYILINI